VLRDGPVANKSFMANPHKLKRKWPSKKPSHPTACLNHRLRWFFSVKTHQSKENNPAPLFWSIISSTIPPPLATQVKGSSAT
jgi:hypothetical protein